ncbi:alpha/beta hydrolase [Saprospira sp. CCB-QB6]|uniref:alpha/beta fold hydrolase n=1 Tax=Saprospira sp. CCB-QB6 TaxID=3023936 RepID=UPI002349CEE9|nr:alpha/beta hydrolase [Saprospira sp. CCB-QB6]WCL80435.1 alpha/beta hydrolase [Saprospira sp. CCB-QB6]
MSLSAFLQIQDYQLHYQIIGNFAPEKPLLVLLHEGLGALPLWKGWPDELAQALNCPILLYERRGYGQSDPLPLPRPKNYLEKGGVEELHALLSHLQVQQPILIGHSDGGSIALAYAAQYAVKALAVLAAHIYVEEVTLAGILAVKNNPQLPKIIQKLGKYHGTESPRIFSAWADTWLRADFKSWNIAQLLPQIQAPAFVLQGEADEYASPKHLSDIFEGLGSTDKEQHLLPNCGHSPHIQARTALNALILPFLSRQISL